MNCLKCKMISKINIFHHFKISFKRYDGTPMLLILLSLCLCFFNMGVSFLLFLDHSAGLQIIRKTLLLRLN